MKHILHYGVLLILITTSIRAEKRSATFTRISGKQKARAPIACAAECLDNDDCTGLRIFSDRCEPVNNFDFYRACNPDTYTCFLRMRPPCVESIHYNMDMKEIIVTYHGYDQVVRYPSDYPKSINSIHYAQTKLDELPKSSVFSYLPDDVKDMVFYESAFGSLYYLMVFDGMSLFTTSLFIYY
jgi:hypothetical protein